MSSTDLEDFPGDQMGAGSGKVNREQERMTPLRIPLMNAASRLLIVTLIASAMAAVGIVTGLLVPIALRQWGEA